MVRTADYRPGDSRAPSDSSEELTLTDIRPPTRVNLAGDPWLEDAPTLVLDRPSHQPASEEHELSVVFRGVRSAQPSSVPPPPASVRPLLPPPAEVVIPRAPRMPTEVRGTGSTPAVARSHPSRSVVPPPAQSSLVTSVARLPPFHASLPALAGSPVESTRPLAYDTGGAPPPPFQFWQKPLHLAAAALVGGAAILTGYSYWQNQHGELVVDIADQQCGSLENVRVYIDDELRCTVAPCTLTVRSGGHVVRAEVDGKAATAAQAVFVSADMPALHKIQVGASDKTAIEVRGGPQRGELYIDGRPEGHIPRRVSGLMSGEHLVQVRSPSGTIERRVSLQEEQLLVLDLPVPNARTDALSLGSASDFTARGGSNDRSARTTGNESRSSRGSNEETAKSNIAPASGEEDGNGAPNASLSTATKGDGTLRLTAEPSAMVLLNGKPLGHTPQRVSVTPGTHSLIFVHPTEGRTRTTVNVKPGQTRNLHARF